MSSDRDQPQPFAVAGCNVRALGRRFGGGIGRDSLELRSREPARLRQ